MSQSERSPVTVHPLLSVLLPRRRYFCGTGDPGRLPVPE